MHLIRRPSSQFHKYLRQWAFPLVGFGLAFSLSIFLSGLIPDSVRLENDLWFGADIKRVINNMVDPESFHFKTYHHPLFSLLMLPAASPIFWIAKMIGFDPTTAKIFTAQLITSISAGITWTLVYLISLKMGLSKYQSFSVGLLFLPSSAFIFWWSTPETFSIGSSTILLPILLLGLKVKSRSMWLIALVTSAAITITNFSAGLIALLARFRSLKTAIKLTFLALACTSLLYTVQASYIPPSRSPIRAQVKEDRWIKTTYRPADYLYKFFTIPIIAPLTPTLTNISNLSHPTNDLFGKKMLQLHFGAPGNNNTSSGVLKRSPRIIFEIPLTLNTTNLRMSAALAWILFLMNGIYSAFFRRQNATCLALVIFLATQFFLHLLYGDTPFLYSAHYVPIMILIGGYGLIDMPNLSKKIFSLGVVAVAAVVFVMNLKSFLVSIDLGVEYLLKYGAATVNW